MTRLKSSLVVLACCAALAGPASAQSDIGGVWEVTLNTPQGSAVIEATFKQEAETVTGSVVSPMGSVEFKGTFIKDTLSITYPLPLQGQTLDITMTGTLAGETMSGTIALGPLGELPWTAKRKPPSTATSPASPSSAEPAAPAEPDGASLTPSDANGKWDIVLSIGQGQLPLTAVLTQAGEKVTGTLSSAAGATPVRGTMIGTTLKLEFTAPTPQGPLPVAMTGDLGANGFTGKATITGLGEANWTGTRARQ